MSIEPVPTDIIFQVLCHSDPQDIIRWRTVSKAFHAITRELALWKTLYKNAPFPRPFATQSVTSIERMLLKAARLAESWTTRPMYALSSLTISSDKAYTKPPKLISGRWLVVFESDKQFVLHDVDPATGRHTRQILWVQENPEVSDWNVESIISPEGHCVVYVFLGSSYPTEWKLREFWLNRDSGEVFHSVAIDPPPGDIIRARKMALYTGNSRLLFMNLSPIKQMVFDTRTRIFHKIPLLTTDPLEWLVVSDTSLIAFCHQRYRTLIYVFTLPPDDVGNETTSRTLWLTHEGDIYHTALLNVKVLGYTVDPATETTVIRLLDYSLNDDDPLELQYVGMTLQKCCPGVVLPINIEKRAIKLPRERVRPSRYKYCCKYIDICDDGQIRGFFRAKKRDRNPRPWDTIENQLIMKFAIDTTQDPWVISRSQIAPAEWSNEVDPRFDQTQKGIVFDGMRGRLCYIHPNDASMLMVADIE